MNQTTTRREKEKIEFDTYRRAKVYIRMIHELIRTVEDPDSRIEIISTIILEFHEFLKNEETTE